MTASSSIYLPCAVRVTLPLPERFCGTLTYTVAVQPTRSDLTMLPEHCIFAMPRMANATPKSAAVPVAAAMSMGAQIFSGMNVCETKPHQPPSAKNAVRLFIVNSDSPSPTSPSPPISMSPSEGASKSTSLPNEKSSIIICTTNSTLAITAIRK